jgi:hypothetical protein
VFGEAQNALIAAGPYLVPVLVIGVGIRLWWERRQAKRPR